MTMRMDRRVAWVVPALMVVLAACSDDEPSAPGETELSADEAGFLAVETDRALDAVLGGLFSDQAGFSAPAEPAATEPIVREFSFERTHSCPDGGQVVVSGEGSMEVDPEIGMGEMNVAGTKTIEACARERDGVVYTTNGSLEFDAHWLREDFELVEAEKNLIGAFSVETSDDRTKECTIELHTVFDPETETVTVTGEVCGRTVERTWDRSGRRPL